MRVPPLLLKTTSATTTTTTTTTTTITTPIPTITKIFILLTIYRTPCSGASPKNPLCKDTYRVAWMEISPYVDNVHDKHNKSELHGIMVDILNNATRACCRGKFTYDFSARFRTQEDILDIPNLHTVDFIVPVQKDIRAKNMEHFPFVGLVQSPGIAFYVQPEQGGGKEVLRAMKSLKPLIILMFLFVSISSVCFWLCENITIACHGNKPESFVRGMFSGFWWAFISMTTVGYGDLVPQTKPAKIFSVMWVLFGAAFCACFTSVMTSMLQLSLMGSYIPLSGTEVAVVRGSQEHKYALHKQAIPVVFDNITLLLQSIDHNQVSALLLDVYVAIENTEKLEHLHLQEIIEHIFFNGVAFQNEGFQHVSCIRDHVSSRQMEIFELISRRVRFTRLVSSHNPPSSSIDYRKPSFYVTVLGLMGTLVSILVIGYSVEKFYLWRKLKKEKEDYQALEEMSLSQWRIEYKRELSCIVRAVFDDMDKIKTRVEVIKGMLRYDPWSDLDAD